MGFKLSEIEDFFKKYVNTPHEETIYEPTAILLTGDVDGAWKAGRQGGDNFFSGLFAGDEVEPEKGVLLNKDSGVNKIPVIYGKRRVGGSYAVRGWVSGVSNEYIHIIQVLSEGEIEAIDEIYIDGVISTDDRFTGLTSITKYLGTTTQAADPIMLAAFSGVWTTAHQLKGLAYLAIRLKWDDSEEDRAFSGYPTITANIRGKKIYDPRTATTYFSANPVLVLRDYLTNTLYGKGLAATSINDSEVIVAANIADTIVKRNTTDVVTGTDFTFDNGGDGCIDASTTDLTPLFNSDFIIVEGSASNDDSYSLFSIGASSACLNEALSAESPGASVTITSAERLFEFNGSINTGRRIIDNVASILVTFRGLLPYIQGKFEPMVRQDETVSFDFNSDNIIGALSIKGPSKKTRLNRVKVRFSNPDKEYKADVAISDSTTFRAIDNGLILERETTMSHEISYSRSLHRAETLLKESRETTTVGFVATMEAYKVKAGSIVTITHNTPGWVAKTFRVMQINLLVSGNVQITLFEHEATAYDRTVSVDKPPPANTNLPNPLIVVTPTNLIADGSETHLVLVANGAIITRALVTWTAPLDIFVIRTDIEYKLTTDTAYTAIASVNGRATTQTYISNLEDGKTYDFRIRHVNTQLVFSPWVYTSEYIEGKITPPVDVPTFLVSRQSDGTRQYSWTYPSPALDHAGFIIGVIAGAGGTWAGMAPLVGAEFLPPGIRSFESNQLLAGQWTLGIKAVDTTGNESTNALIIEETLGDPRLANAFDIVDLMVDGWSGTKTDCEVDDNGILHANDQNDWSNLTTWTAWGSTWPQNPFGTIVYEHTAINLGGIVTFTPNVSISHNADTLTITEAHSDDDITYTSFAAITGVITAQYIKIKLTFTSTPEYIQVTGGSIILSGDPITEFIEDLLTSTIATNAGDFRAPPNNTYAKIKHASLTLQSVSGGWSWTLIDKGNIDVNNLRWLASTAYSLGDQVYPDANDNGRYYQCTTAGTSGGTEPATWPASGTLADGGVTWTEYGLQGPRFKIYNATPALANATVDVNLQGL